MQLTPASFNLVPEILSILKNHGYDSKTSHNELQGLTSWRNHPECPEMLLLTPGGTVDQYGTFVLLLPTLRYTMHVHTLNPDLAELANDLLTNPHIDWKRSPIIGCTHERFNPLLAIIEAGLPNSKREDAVTRSHHIARSDAMKLTLSVPEDLFLANIGLEYAGFINNLWPHGGTDESFHEIYSFLKFRPSRGLFRQDTGELIAWCLYGEYGGPGQLQTLEAYKKKGYAEIVLKAMTKIAAENGVDPHAFIILDNIASASLFKKVGYVPKYKASWATFFYNGNEQG